MRAGSFEAGREAVPAEYRRRSRRHAVSWVFYGSFFAVATGLGPFVIRQLGGTALQCMMANLGQAIPLIFAILWVPFIERHNPVRLTGLLLGLGGAALLFSFFARSARALSLILLGSMLLSTVSRPSLGTALRQVYPQRWRGQLLSLPNAAAILAQALCLMLAGRLLRADPSLYRFVFPAAGVAMVIGGMLFGRMPGGFGSDAAPNGRMVAQIARSVRATLDNRILLVFLLGYFVTTFGSMGYWNVLPLFARDELKLTTEQWGMANGGFMVAMLVSMAFWGRFLDRFGAVLTVVVSWLLQSAIFALVFFVHSWHPFLVLVVVRGLFQGGNMLAFFPVVMELTRSHETTRGMGLHFSLWGVRWTLTALLVAWVVDGQLFPMRYVFVISTVLCLMGIVVMAGVHRGAAGRGEPRPTVPRNGGAA